MRSDYAASKQSRAEERKRAKAVADAEERVHALEARLARLENDLHVATVEQDLDGIQRLGQAYTDTQVELEAAMEEWAELA